MRHVQFLLILFFLVTSSVKGLPAVGGNEVGNVSKLCGDSMRPRGSDMLEEWM